MKAMELAEILLRTPDLELSFEYGGKRRKLTSAGVVGNRFHMVIDRNRGNEIYLSFPMKRILRNLRDGRPASEGYPHKGRLPTTIAALHKRGLVDREGKLTDKGRVFVKEMKR